ncbi:MAG TPA: hypothetical protein VN606_17280 [Thermoleophilaceae bacterium]|nr:hypothetical protein [Thermoleophilaceae bacterium]
MASDRGRLISLYERVAELGERELELVRTGQYEQLEPLHAEREDLIAVLPDAPPAEASTALLRAAAVQAQVEALLSGSLAHARAQLVRLDRGRDAMSGYATQVPKPVHRVDTSG